jgi:hypothetical protein
MSKDDNEELTLRDKMAIAIFQGIISSEDSSSDFVETFDSKDIDQKNHYSKRMERKIRAAYKLADMMRKVRLAPFE